MAHHPSPSRKRQSSTSSQPPGIAALLAKYAKSLPASGTVTVTLVKGPSSQSADPIAARRASAIHSDGSLATLGFPRIAKFPETVVPPDWRGRWREGRLYEEDVPKIKDDSEEDESTSYRHDDNNNNNNNNNNSDSTGMASLKQKKKRRWRRHDPRPKRWVLQEQNEFLERVAAKKKKRAILYGGHEQQEHDAQEDDKKISTQYHGVVESNSSKYVLLSVNANDSTAAVTPPKLGAVSSFIATENITVQTVHGFHTFSQPYKVAALSMEEAEHALERQRNVLARYTMHTAGEKSDVSTGKRQVGRPMGPPPKAMSRARLLGKLVEKSETKDGEDEDDIMGDITFTSMRGSSSRARKELLSSMADEGLTVDGDGVLGGANDAEFGGRRHFAHVAMNKNDGLDAPGKKGTRTDAVAGEVATGFEAAAMEEGFYQRDVSAEYEALDYDVNEQFDDDDVNLGEDEIQDDGGGFGGDFHDSGEDEFDSEEDEDPDDDLFKGIASTSGLKAMIAKARGESPVTLVDGAGISGMEGSPKASLQATEETTAKGETGMNKLLETAKKTADDMDKKKEELAPISAEDNLVSPTSTRKFDDMGIKKDKDGKRLITMEAIRKEIWVHNGAIKSKRLMKIFDVTNKNPERQAVFKSIVMELCTMKKDADGNKLVLKQHYAKSG